MASSPPAKSSTTEAHSDAPSREQRQALLQQGLSKLAAIFLYTFGIGSGLGLFAALFMLPERHGFSATNALKPAFRSVALFNVGSWILGSLVVIGAWLLVRRSWKRVERTYEVVRALSPLGWAWPLPLFFDWEVFQGSGLARLVIALIWGLGLERSFRHTFRVFDPQFSEWVGHVPAKVRTILPLVALFGLVTWFGVFCSHYTIMQHERLMTHGFDLGIFDNLFFNLLEGEWFRGGVDVDNRGGAHLQFHANFLAYLFLPVYALSPRAETLLILQAWLVGSSAIPLYLIAKHRLRSSGAGLIIAAAYLVHEAVQGPVFYDFHFLTISPFFIGWTLYFFERGWKWPLLGAWLCAILLREDQGAILGAAALVYLLMGHRPLLAIAGGVLGVAWLALMRFYVMPLHAADGTFHQHIGIFQAMVAPGEAGYGGVLKTMITNPVFTLNNVLEQIKLEYVLLLGTPFVLLPFRSPRLLFLFIPAAMFTLGTANYPPPVSKGFQYTMYWMPLLALGTTLKLSEWRENQDVRLPAGLAAIFVLSMSLGFNGGALFQQNSFTGGFRRIEFKMSDQERERIKELRELVKKIPKDATLTATEAVVPHVSNRRDAHTLRQGIGDPDYLLFWTQELRGGEQAKRLVQGLGPLKTQRYGVIERTANFQLWKRGASRKKNLKALQAAGHYRHVGKKKTSRRGKRKASRPVKRLKAPKEAPSPPPASTKKPPASSAHSQ